MRILSAVIMFIVGVVYAQDTTCYPPILIHTEYGYGWGKTSCTSLNPVSDSTIFNDKYQIQFNGNAISIRGNNNPFRLPAHLLIDTGQHANLEGSVEVLMAKKWHNRSRDMHFEGIAYPPGTIINHQLTQPIIIIENGFLKLGEA